MVAMVKAIDGKCIGKDFSVLPPIALIAEQAMKNNQGGASLRILLAEQFHFENTNFVCCVTCP
jgi:hypothetical protein